MIIGNQAAIDVRLGEGVAQPKSRSVVAKSTVRRCRRNRVRQAGSRIVDVAFIQHGVADCVGRRSFVNRCSSVDRNRR